MADPANEPLDVVHSRIMVVAQEDIDTDQILPARFMTDTGRGGLGKALFRDWREAEAAQGHRFDHSHADRILVAGRNFGIGSSREHAVWALMDFGFRVVISPAFGDIFAGNAMRNGLLTVVVPTAVYEQLRAADGSIVTVDLWEETLTVPAVGLTHRFHTDPFTRRCLLNGLDALAFLVEQEMVIACHAARCAVPLSDLRGIFDRG